MNVEDEVVAPRMAEVSMVEQEIVRQMRALKDKRAAAVTKRFGRL